jgi:hypothetical protein
MKRIWLLILITVITYNNSLMAQKTENYKASWEKMAAFEKNGQTASARKEAMLVYRLAFEDGNQPQQIHLQSPGDRRRVAQAT